MTTPQFKKSIGRSLFWQCGFVLIPLALACFGLSPAAKAVLPPPPPDGGYPGANTAEGNGNFNMAIGFRALYLNTGSRNSAIGAAALRNNLTASDNTAIGSTAMNEN